jgi:deoxyribose-phosphate aldolase
VNIKADLDRSTSIASLIDQTLLRPEADRSQIQALCASAHNHAFASVCVNPCWVKLAVEMLEQCAVKVCTVIGFPLGANTASVKHYEAERALSEGARELDVVLNLGFLLSGKVKSVGAEIATLSALAHRNDAILKVILETCLLSDEQKRTACHLAVDSGAEFVKTSTGFSKHGATIEDVKLMRQEVGDRAGVKASGGIRNLNTLRDMVHAGANRIGTSAGVEILAELAAERQGELAATHQSPADY